MEDQEIRILALQLAVELRKRTPEITGDLTVTTATKFAKYIREGLTR